MSEQINQLRAMSDEELRDQAKALGVSLKGNPANETIISRIAEVLGETEEAEPAPVKVITRSDKEVYKKTHTVIVSNSEDDKRPVQIGHNGRQYNIPRNVEVKIPKCIYDLLQAKEVRLERNAETGETRTYTVMKYPNQLVSVDQ